MAEILGKLQIYGDQYFVNPDDYQVIYDDGEPSRMLPSSGGTIIDVGYVRLGFTAKLHIPNASKVVELQEKVLDSIRSKTPTIVFDTVYPGDRTWYGFFKPNIVVNGVIKSNGRFGFSDDINLTPVTVTFHSNALEQM